MKQYLNPGDEVTAVCLAAYVGKGEYAVDNESLSDLIYYDDESGIEYTVHYDEKGPYYDDGKD